METKILILFACVLLLLRGKNLLLENLALRQQLAIMKQKNKRPKISIWDRFFWVSLSIIWKDWKSVLIVVQPETVIRWHRKGFKLFWAYKSRKKGAGRPSLDPEITARIKNMAKPNPRWGVPRIHGEQLKLGYNVHERTVSKIIKRFRLRKPPSQTWRTFLKNHMFSTYAVDLFKVPTANFQVLSVLVIIRHDTRECAFQYYQATDGDVGCTANCRSLSMGCPAQVFTQEPGWYLQRIFPADIEKAVQCQGDCSATAGRSSPSV